MTVSLVLGGARSGKSTFAEQMAIESGRPLVYLATAQAFDDEMRQRIDLHKERRGKTWHNIEEPLDIIDMLKSHDDGQCCILVDCLTLWLSNLIFAKRDVDAEREALALWISAANRR